MTRAKAPRRSGPPEIRFYPNDPDAPVGLQPATPVTPGVGEPTFTIDGKRYAPAPYAPGTLAFQYWQGEVALARTIRVWEELFERDFTQWHTGRPLRVKLRAGKDLNAFYDRESLQFFYDLDRKTERPVYAAESLDIVAHETGHAVLDVYQPGFWSTPDLETASFHEAFADCSALLVTLTDPAVRKALLTEADGNWNRSNQVSRLAEALGRAIYDNYGPGAVSDPTRLRDARNDFQYADPASLPPGADDSMLAPEPHSFSRVFTGAFYDAFVWALDRALKQEGSDEDAIERARRLVGRALARAIEKLPPGNARYADVAALMRAADQSEEGGAATVGIETAFAKHGIALPPFQGARAAHPSPLRALDPELPGGLAAMRAALHLPPSAKLVRKSSPLATRDGWREQLLHVDEYRIRHRSLGDFDDILVRIPCGCTITRAVSGEVDDMTLAPHPHPSPAEVLRSLRPWIRLDAIHPERGLKSSTREFFRERKPFRLTAEGLLTRVYFDGTASRR
ncbi:MAG TPA: hypothetical protein VK527_00695 [Candidatus Limnocylindrales bacterium]|nr:hypothetical protein [Candidatus Limnocylindrales bacterium]